MATTLVTPSMQAHADVLLHRSERWARGVDNEKGVAFFLFVSSRTDREGRPIYHKTTRDGSGCTCPSYYHRGICAHALAAQRAAERARAQAAKPSKRYEDLWPDNVDAF
jgi:hypothetical protein